MAIPKIRSLAGILLFCLFAQGAAISAEAAVSKTSKRVLRLGAAVTLTASDFSAAALSTTSIQWSWSTAAFTGSGIDGYYLYSSSTSARAVLPPSTSFYIDAGLGVNKSYTRWLTAYDGSDEGSDSQHMEKYTYALPPTTITLSSVTAESAYVTWHFSSATAYAVECSTNGGAEYIRNRDVFVPWQTITLLSNRNYLIRLGAVNGDNELTPGVYSAVKAATTPPLDLTMTGVAISSYTIQWQWSTGTFAGTGITGYRIYHSTTTDDDTIPVDGCDGGIVHTIVGVDVSSWTETFVDIETTTYSVDAGSVTSVLTYAANSRHTRWIKAVGILESPGTFMYQKYTYAIAPATCTAVYGDPAVTYVYETYLNLNWNLSPASAYVIDYSTAADFTLSLTSAIVSGAPATVSALTENTKYDFRLGAINGDGEQTPDNVLNPLAYSGVYRVMTRPSPPYAFSCAPFTDTALHCSWSTAAYVNISYIAGYGIGEIKYNEDGTSYWDPLDSIDAADSREYSLDYLLTNSTHTVSIFTAQTDPAWGPVHGFDPAWYYSRFGSSVLSDEAATFATPPNDVVFDTVGARSAGMWWREPEVPATQYRVERSTTTGERGPWVFISSVTGAHFQDTGLTPSTTYSYRLGAINLLGFQTIGLSSATGGNRRDYSFVSSTITRHVAPTLYAVATGTTSIIWQWTDTVPGVLSYTLYTSSGGVIIAGLSAATTYWAEVNLSSANARYTRRVRSIAADGEGDYCEASASTLANPPAAAVITSSAMHSMSLGWAANGSARYKIDRSLDGSSWTGLKAWSDVFVSTWFNDSGLRYATTYYYAVSGYNDDGIVSVSSAIPAGANMTRPLPAAYTVVFTTATVSLSVTAPLPGVGQLTVEIPAGSPDGYFTISTGAAASPIEIAKSSLDAATAKLSNASLLSGSIVELHLYDVYGYALASNLSSPARITITYTDSNNDGIVDGTSPQMQVSTLKLFNLDTGALVWNQQKNSVINKSAKSVYADISHFSLYALGSVTSTAGALAGVFAYPNPYRPLSSGDFGQSAFGDGIVFESLPARAKVRIFGLAGTQVADLNDYDGDGRCLWNTRNPDGAKVASGIYLYVVTGPDSSDKKTGKVAIIR